MNDLVFITGNQKKADYLAKWLGMAVPYRRADVDEIQSLDLGEVVGHKARQAYEIVKQPVLVEDVALTFHGLGRLPGTLIRWFLEELGNEGLADLAATLETQAATASILYGLYDGERLRTFASDKPGRIASTPRGENGFGWNAVFIPEGYDKTYAEMTDAELRQTSLRAEAIEKLRAFLQNP